MKQCSKDASELSWNFILFDTYTNYDVKHDHNCSCPFLHTFNVLWYYRTTTKIASYRLQTFPNGWNALDRFTTIHLAVEVLDPIRESQARDEMELFRESTWRCNARQQLWTRLITELHSSSSLCSASSMWLHCASTVRRGNVLCMQRSCIHSL